MSHSPDPKKKMQNVSFDTITEFLEFLPDDQLQITEILRRLIFECVPDIEEYLSFNIACYRRNAVMLFIWPGAISWGKFTHPGVRLGFQWGCLLTDEIGYLDRGDRKQVFWRDFYDPSEIDMELLRAYIFEAVVVDDAKPKRKRKA